MYIYIICIIVCIVSQNNIKKSILYTIFNSQMKETGKLKTKQRILNKKLY